MATLLAWLKNRFVGREYIRLSIDGTGCIQTPLEAIDLLRDSENPKEYEVEAVIMTPYAFRRLPEFPGF